MPIAATAAADTGRRLAKISLATTGPDRRDIVSSKQNISNGHKGQNPHAPKDVGRDVARVLAHAIGIKRAIRSRMHRLLKQHNKMLWRYPL